MKSVQIRRIICFGLIWLLLPAFQSEGRTQTSATGASQKGRAIYEDVEIPTVKFCDLINEPVKYDNKLVRVSGTYSWGFEASVFSNSACESKQMWVVPSPRFYEWTDPKVLKQYKRIVEPIGTKYRDGVYPGGGGEVTFVGWFAGPRPPTRTPIPGGYIETVPGYGHLNGYCCELGVVYVEEVHPAKASDR